MGVFLSTNVFSRSEQLLRHTELVGVSVLEVDVDLDVGDPDMVELVLVDVLEDVDDQAVVQESVVRTMLMPMSMTDSLPTMSMRWSLCSRVVEVDVEADVGEGGDVDDGERVELMLVDVLDGVDDVAEVGEKGDVGMLRLVPLWISPRARVPLSLSLL
eukprot:5993186-Amphidinium_carterae.1